MHNSTKYLEINQIIWDISTLINYKKLPIEVKEDLKKWRKGIWPWIGRLSVVKISVFFNLTYRFNPMKMKTSSLACEYIDKLILEVTWKCKGQESRTNEEFILLRHVIKLFN